jgi:hypothetical protein
MNDSQPEAKNKRITVVHLPETNLPNDVYETSTPLEKAGYHLSKEGEAPTYRLFVGSKTVLVPQGIVHRIILEL